MGTRLFKEFEGGEWYWGEIVAAPLPEASEDEVQYGAIWSDNEHTSISASEGVAGCAAARRKAAELGMQRPQQESGKPTTRIKSPTLAPFDEAGEEGGHPTVKVREGSKCLEQLLKWRTPCA